MVRKVSCTVRPSLAKTSISCIMLRCDSFVNFSRLKTTEGRVELQNEHKYLMLIVLMIQFYHFHYV